MPKLSVCAFTSPGTKSRPKTTKGHQWLYGCPRILHGGNTEHAGKVCLYRYPHG
ncbi:hypothetical protein DPMN_080078 [Dreissena polymorpha]|uniref:Uncharacterized protein n=1 Tax=Dreissena polymorpha TaxID=45954 RepID=A0A9D4BIX2_DREPO|nr:hypothetical protein DPMN_080078 [Dreissena polymorpha]